MSKFQLEMSNLDLLPPKVAFQDETVQNGFRTFKTKSSFLVPLSTRILYRFFDVILLVPSLIIAIFLIVVINLNGKPVSDDSWTIRIHEASRLGPTIVPIVFTIVLGQMTRKAARWKLEKGEKIGVLELLQGSSTLINTVSTTFKLRRCSLLSIMLFAAWSFSPLGGQATLRIIGTSDLITNGNTTLWYPLLNSSSSFKSANAFGYTGILTNTLFLSALTSSIAIRNNSMDNHGNVKIPFISSITNETTDENLSNWIDLKNPNESVVFSSFIGIPISNLPREGDIEFVMESSYFDLNCPIFKTNEDVTSLNMNTTLAFPNTTFFTTSKRPLSLTTSLDLGNDTSSTFNTTSLKSYSRDFYMYTILLDSARSQIYTECTITQRFVESSITCLNGNCSVIAMRNSQVPHNLVQENYLQVNGFPYENFLTSLLGITTHGGVAANPSLLETYVTNITDPFWAFNPLYIQSSNGTHMHDALSQLSNVTFSYRLCQLLNSYWQAGTYLSVLDGYVLTPEDIQRESNFTDPPVFAMIPASTLSYQSRYSFNKTWALILVLCFAVLLIAGVTNVVLGFYIHGPDIIGYVSSLTRDNIHCPMPEVGSVMDGEERSRFLSDVYVQLNHCNTNQQGTGYMAVTWSSPVEEKAKTDEECLVDKSSGMIRRSTSYYG